MPGDGFIMEQFAKEREAEKAEERLKGFEEKFDELAAQINEIKAAKAEQHEGYPEGWVKAVLMINPKTKEIHAIGGDRESGAGDTAYIGLELIKKWINGKD